MPNGNAPNLKPLESEQAMENPQSNEEVFLGSFSAVLQNNIGQYVACEFLIGNNVERKEGILYSGGINYVTLYQPSEESYVVCDMYSLKFVTIYDTTKRPISTLIPRNPGGQPGYQQPHFPPQQPPAGMPPRRNP